MNKDTELHLLETIYSQQGGAQALSQRDLAGAADLSLGMTNALIRRFVERGWVKLMHLSGRSLKYILTSEGMEEILHRSLSYFTRAAKSASLYRDKIDAYVIGLAKAGFSVVVLEGPAELDFLFDYSCERHGLEFVKNPQEPRHEALLALPEVMFIKAAVSFDRPDIVLDVEKDEALGAGLSVIEPRASTTFLTDILFDQTVQAGINQD